MIWVFWTFAASTSQMQKKISSRCDGETHIPWPQLVDSFEHSSLWDLGRTPGCELVDGSYTLHRLQQMLTCCCFSMLNAKVQNTDQQFFLTNDVEMQGLFLKDLQGFVLLSSTTLKKWSLYGTSLAWQRKKPSPRRTFTNKHDDQ